MRYLLDTGIIVRLLHRSDPEHDSIRQALRRLAAQGHALVCARQNIVEFWNLSTRPFVARGGFGLSVAETAHRLRILERIVEVLNEPDSSYRHWKTLVTRYGVAGRQVHDARIVSIMLAYRIKRVLTLNGTDFTRYPQIRAFSPTDILA